MKKLKAVALLTILIALFSAEKIRGQIKESETVLTAQKTARGNLELVKSVSGDAAAVVFIKLNGKNIKELNYVSAYVEQSYPQSSPKIFLVGLSTESLVCAVKFVILDLSKNRPKISEEFGNCSDAPKLIYRNQSLTLDFPMGRRGSKYTIGKKQIWIYRDGQLKKLK